MNRSIRILCICILPLFVSTVFAEPDILDSCFSQLGMTREQFRVDPEMLMVRTGTAYKLPVFEQWFAHPLKIPTWEQNWRTALLANTGNAHGLFSSGASILSMVTRRDLIAPTPLDKSMEKAKEKNALKNAILALDPRAKIPGTDSIPELAQRSATILLLATKTALDFRELALRAVPHDSLPSLYKELIEPMEKPQKPGDSTQAEEPFPESLWKWYSQTDLLGKIDYTLLNAGGDDLSNAFDAASRMLDSIPHNENYYWTCKTKFGTIILSGGTNNRYDDKGHYLMILDTGGDDVYTSGGSTGGANYPVGLLIDTDGNDQYISRNGEPNFGCGVLGYGMLTDLRGDDQYESSGCYAEGCGVAGIGLLLDRAGNDTYRAFESSQGFGFFGVGILADSLGNDKYSAYMECQGCGMTLGFGLLVDGAGNDRYIAEDDTILFPGQQSDKHNTSLSQGAGFGLRRDYVDAHSFAGGVGILMDGAGNDYYSGGIFAQSIGYWYGIGVLDDRSGDDVYKAAFYAQSATAHMGISYFVDGGGSDSLTTTIAMGACCPHDFSESIFLKEGGKSIYSGVGNSLCTSMNSSMALFVDYGSNNVYATNNGFADCINYSNTGLRAETPTVAVFLSLGGNNKYPEGKMHGDSTKIFQPKAPLPILKGIAIDKVGGKIKWE